LIKTGLVIAALILGINSRSTVIRQGITPLDNYQQWERQGLYPVGARRLGHILETYIEPIKWIKFKEILFDSPWFVVLVVLSGVVVVGGKKLDRKGKMGLWIWAGPILALIIFTRQLVTVPSGIYVDEAVTGYNASSVLLTGRDEYGKAFPILFRYFGSWLPFLNMYLLAPIVRIIGLSELAVRLPAALLGVGVVLVMYVLLKLKTRSESLAVWGAVFMAVVPWMVFNARLGYEEMIGFILFSAGCGLLWRSVTERKNLVWAIMALSLSSYAAHVFRYLEILILPLWLVINWSEVRHWPFKFWRICFGWLLITQIPNIIVAGTPAFWVKQVIYEGVSVFKIAGNFWYQLVTYFSPVTLFVRIPDIDLQHQIPGTGLFHWWMIVPIVWGITGWVKNWRHNKWWLALLGVSVIPAAMSGAFISVQRALPLLLPLSMAMAEGLGYLVSGWGRVKKTLFLTGLLGYSGLLLFRSYFVLLPGLYQEAWNYGYKELTEEIKRQPRTKFIVDNSRNVRNYILPLFYLRFPPGKLQKTADEKVLKNYYFSGDPADVHKYANLEFRPIYWKEDVCVKQILVGDELAISEKQAQEHFLIKSGEVRSRTGKLLLQWWETDPKKKCGKI
jgi:4-amino-4-deoxy-L-arabinose transferase-like glycosyltransferase